MSGTGRQLVSKKNTFYNLFLINFSKVVAPLMQGPRGSIISPGYPKSYPDNAQCEWKISVSEGSTIKIVFTDLDLEAHAECKYDFLEVFDGRDSSSNSFGTFCNSDNHPTHIETSSNHAFIRLTTDNSHGGRGFSIKYSINCNRTITGYDGVIESPNFPSPYANNLDCHWKIQANLGNIIKIDFSHFELENINAYESSANNNAHICGYDYLEIKDGTAIKYCNHAPPNFNSTRNTVDIMYV